MTFIEPHGHGHAHAPDASSPKLEVLRQAHAAAVEVELWERARAYAQANGSDGRDGLIEHVYFGLQSDYRSDARYRNMINAFADARLMDAIASRPAAPVQ